MNKKGFTLVELLATIAIIAIIATLAVPNIISMVSNGKTKSVIADAKEIIAQAKKERVKYAGDYPYEITLKDLDIDLDPNNDESDESNPDKDAYGNAYDKDNTKVKITEAYQNEDGESCSKGNLGCFKTYVYSIKYVAGEHKLTHENAEDDGYIKEQDLENATYE